MKKTARGMSVVMLISIFALPVHAAEEARQTEDEKGIFSAVLENDIFAGTDRGYTNGARFAWMSSETHIPEWANDAAQNFLPLTNDGKKRISLAMGQNMYAPDDKTRTDLIRGDRPYAGWLYGSLGMISDAGKLLDTAVLTVGVVGPLSGAEQTQKFVHRTIHDQKPHGWDNQLDNEPGMNFAFERKWRNFLQESALGLSVDVIPHVGMNVGNITTDASAGATLRAGFDLPADYGPPRIRPSLPGSDFFIPTQEIGGYVFTTVDQRAVGRNIFLDGNTFGGGPSVDKNILVSSLQVGVAFTYNDARISYTQVFTTKEFKGETSNPQFGALTISYRF